MRTSLGGTGSQLGRVAVAHVQTASAVKGGGACSKHVLNTRLCRRVSIERRGAYGPSAGGNALWAKAGTHAVTTDHGVRMLDEVDEAGPAANAVGTANEPVDFDTLYREQSPRLLRSLTRRTASAEDARDLVQEIFCRVAGLAAGKDLSAIDRPHAYLSRIATNLLRDRAKRASRRMAQSHFPADECTLVGTDQQRLLEARDMLQRVETAVLRLRPRTREIFMAHRVEGLSYAEIAQRTGLSIKGVEKQMSKAIAAIDRMLERDRA